MPKLRNSHHKRKSSLTEWNEMLVKTKHGQRKPANTKWKRTSNVYDNDNESGGEDGDDEDEDGQDDVSDDSDDELDEIYRNNNNNHNNTGNERITTRTDTSSTSNLTSNTTINDKNELDNLSSETNKKRKGSFVFGLILLLLVVLIWVGSAELQQYIFDTQFNSPMFLTYVNNSAFSLYLLGFLVSPKWRRKCGWKLFSKLKCKLCGFFSHQSNQEIYEPVLRLEDAEESRSSTQDQTEENANETNNGPPETSEYSIAETMNIALKFSMLWFVANYFYNLSLTKTTIASATILSSTSGVWTLIFGAFCLKTNEDAFTWTKFLSVLISLGGVIVLNSGDVSFGLGDIFALASAIFYASYLTLFKYSGDDGELDMAMFFGFVGLSNMIFTLPLFLIFDVSGWEPFSWPTSETWGFLCLNAFVGTLVSDYIWLWSTLLTTPAVTTLGLSLTIPLAISLDVIFGKLSLTGLYLLGTGLVFLGFLLINLEVLYNISVATLYVKLKAACMS